MDKADPMSKPTLTVKDQQVYVFKEIGGADVNDQEQREVVEQHKAKGVVVFGAFVAGSLVGIIIAAPVLVVLVLGAGAAALTTSDSKPGKIARKTGKISSDIIFCIVKKLREMNHKYQITDKVAEAAKRTASRITGENKRRQITKCISAKASSMWKEIDERTRVCPTAQIVNSAQVCESAPVLESVPVTDGTQIPFDGTTGAGAYGVGVKGEGAPKAYNV